MDRDGLPLQNGKHGSASEARACRRNDENSETMSDRKHGCRWKVDGQPTELDRRVLEMARRGCLVPGRELVKTPEQIEGILKQLENAAEYGMVLRAKGYVASQDAERWIHFDYVPGESDIREGGAMITGRVCVIGSKLNESAIASLFGE